VEGVTLVKAKLTARHMASGTKKCISMCFYGKLKYCGKITSVWSGQW